MKHILTVEPPICVQRRNLAKSTVALKGRQRLNIDASIDVLFYNFSPSVAEYDVTFWFLLKPLLSSPGKERHNLRRKLVGLRSTPTNRANVCTLSANSYHRVSHWLWTNLAKITCKCSQCLQTLGGGRSRWSGYTGLLFRKRRLRTIAYDRSDHYRRQSSTLVRFDSRHDGPFRPLM